MDVVVDTSVLVSGLLSPTGKPAAIVEMLLDGTLCAVCDDRVLHEYHAVLRRPELDLEESDVIELLGALTSHARPAVAVHTRAMLPDEKDRCFYECALQCDSEILVTGNRKHFPPAACKGVTVLSPGEFLEWLDDRR